MIKNLLMGTKKPRVRGAGSNVMPTTSVRATGAKRLASKHNTYFLPYATLSRLRYYVRLQPSGCFSVRAIVKRQLSAASVNTKPI